MKVLKAIATSVLNHLLVGHHRPETYYIGRGPKILA
jgi:hypothetical protein